jgi:hypothetical protein
MNNIPRDRQLMISPPILSKRNINECYFIGDSKQKSRLYQNYQQIASYLRCLVYLIYFLKEVVQSTKWSQEYEVFGPGC